MALTIRLATDSDAESCRAIYAPFCAPDSPVSFEIVPPSIEDMKGRIARVMAQYPWLVVDRDGENLGYAYAGMHSERFSYRWSVNVGIYIGEGRRGSGVGRALYTSLFSILRLQGYVNTYAGITLPNPPSEGLHAAMGFEPVGIYKGVGYKAGAWRDVQWWQRPLVERPDRPDPPRSLRDVIGRTGWDDALAAGLPLVRLGQSPA